MVDASGAINEEAKAVQVSPRSDRSQRGTGRWGASNWHLALAAVLSCTVVLAAIARTAGRQRLNGVRKNTASVRASAVRASNDEQRRRNDTRQNGALER